MGLIGNALAFRASVSPSGPLGVWRMLTLIRQTGGRALLLLIALVLPWQAAAQDRPAITAPPLPGVEIELAQGESREIEARNLFRSPPDPGMTVRLYSFSTDFADPQAITVAHGSAAVHLDVDAEAEGQGRWTAALQVNQATLRLSGPIRVSSPLAMTPPPAVTAPPGARITLPRSVWLDAVRGGRAPYGLVRLTPQRTDVGLVQIETQTADTVVVRVEGAGTVTLTGTIQDRDEMVIEVPLTLRVVPEGAEAVSGAGAIAMPTARPTVIAGAVAPVEASVLAGLPLRVSLSALLPPGAPLPPDATLLLAGPRPVQLSADPRLNGAGNAVILTSAAGGAADLRLVLAGADGSTLPLRPLQLTVLRDVPATLHAGGTAQGMGNCLTPDDACPLSLIDRLPIEAVRSISFSGEAQVDRSLLIPTGGSLICGGEVCRLVALSATDPVVTLQPGATLDGLTLQLPPGGLAPVVYALGGSVGAATTIRNLRSDGGGHAVLVQDGVTSIDGLRASNTDAAAVAITGARPQLLLRDSAVAGAQGCVFSEATQLFLRIQGFGCDGSRGDALRLDQVAALTLEAAGLAFNDISGDGIRIDAGVDAQRLALSDVEITRLTGAALRLTRAQTTADLNLEAVDLRVTGGDAAAFVLEDLDGPGAVSLRFEDVTLNGGDGPAMIFRRAADGGDTRIDLAAFTSADVQRQGRVALDLSVRQPGRLDLLLSDLAVETTAAEALRLLVNGDRNLDDPDIRIRAQDSVLSAAESGMSLEMDLNGEASLRMERTSLIARSDSLSVVRRGPLSVCVDLRNLNFDAGRPDPRPRLVFRNEIGTEGFEFSRDVERLAGINFFNGDAEMVLSGPTAAAREAMALDTCNARVPGRR